MFKQYGGITFFGFMTIVYWIGGIIMNTMLAKEKKRDTTGVVLASIFLSPLLSYLYLLAVPVKQSDTK